MRRLFHKQSSTAPLVEVSPEDLASVMDAPGFVWLDMAGEADDSIRELETMFGIDRAILDEAIDHRLLPRLDNYPDFIAMVLHNLVTGGGDRLSTGEVDFYIGADFLVTVHGPPLPAAQWLQDGPGKEATGLLASPGHLAASLAQLISRRFTDILDELDDRVDDLEDMAMTADPRALNEIYVLRREVVMLRRTTGPQREVLREMSRTSHTVIDESAIRVFDNVYDHQVQIAESLESARSLLSADLETYRGAVADQTNEIVRVLTVFSATLLPLTLITGVWGMNFRGLPLVTMRWGFYVLLAVMVGVALGFWIFFVRRGFIGRPRLGELPKSVGLGLVHIGVAPIKIVASGIGSTVRSVSRGSTANDDDND